MLWAEKSRAVTCFLAERCSDCKSYLFASIFSIVQNVPVGQDVSTHSNIDRRSVTALSRPILRFFLVPGRRFTLFTARPTKLTFLNHSPRSEPLLPAFLPRSILYLELSCYCVLIRKIE